MSYATEYIASVLRSAREAKGLSQRALSSLVNVPQGHISKIEGDSVDLRLSSLVEFARALDLEVMLVPRHAVPAVQSIVRTTRPAASTGKLAKKISRTAHAKQQDTVRPAYTLDDENDA